MESDLEEAWEELHAAMPPGWRVGRQSYHDERHQWIQYAYDPSETLKVGVHSREWEAVAQTEVGVVREMARCLREVSAGRVPK